MATTQVPDAIEAAADIHSVLLENERVRVLEYRIKPGEKAEMHSHPDNVIYHLKGTFTASSTPPEGDAREFDVEPGMCLWSPASAHTFENTNGDEGVGLIIELK